MASNQAILEQTRKLQNPAMLSTLVCGDVGLISALRSDTHSLLKDFLLPGCFGESIEDYCPLSDCKKSWLLAGLIRRTFVGVVVWKNTLEKTRTGVFMMSFAITDPSLEDDEKIIVLMFGTSGAMMPEYIELGDVVILANVEPRKDKDGVLKIFCNFKSRQRVLDLPAIDSQRPEQYWVYLNTRQASDGGISADCFVEIDRSELSSAGEERMDGLRSCFLPVARVLLSSMSAVILREEREKLEAEERANEEEESDGEEEERDEKRESSWLDYIPLVKRFRNSQ